MCWSDTSTYFYEFSTKRDPVDNVALPVVFEDLAAGVKSRTVPAMEEYASSEEEEDDDAYLKHV